MGADSSTPTPFCAYLTSIEEIIRLAPITWGSISHHLHCPHLAKIVIMYLFPKKDTNYHIWLSGCRELLESYNKKPIKFAVFEAGKMGDLDLISKMLARGAHAGYLLQSACDAGKMDTAEWIQKRVPDLNPFWFNYGLSYGCEHNNTEMMRWAIQHGASNCAKCVFSFESHRDRVFSLKERLVLKKDCLLIAIFCIVIAIIVAGWVCAAFLWEKTQR